jgi:hypothetical protein
LRLKLCGSSSHSPDGLLYFIVATGERHNGAHLQQDSKEAAVGWQNEAAAGKRTKTVSSKGQKAACFRQY